MSGRLRFGAFAGRATALALLAAGTAGCREGTAGGTGATLEGPPLVRVVLGEPRESAGLLVPDAWAAASTDTRAYADAGRGLVAGLRADGDHLVFRGVRIGASQVRVTPRGPFTITEDDGRRASYRGDLLARAKGGKVVLVNEVDLETYVAGVMANEIGVDAAPAALRAQAVAARSYAFSTWRTTPSAEYHLHDSVKSQVYRGVTLPAASPLTVADLDRETAATRGVILTWRSMPFPAYYASTCGGHTTDAATSDLDPGAATEPLYGVPCRYCTPSRYFAWTETVSTERVCAALKDRGVVPPLRGIEVTSVGRGGWVASVTLTYGSRGAKKVVPGPVFRQAAGLRSMHVDGFELGEATLVVRGRGWGHGVGMCQVGCREMARAGLTETQILRYYYPGAEFTRAY